MKNISLVIGFVWFVNLLNAQEKTHIINGKTYFVYPFQEKITYNKRYFKFGIKEYEKITRDSLNRYIVSSEVVPVEFDYPANRSKSFKKKKKIINQLRHEYPYALYNTEIGLEKDITPSLQPLKDGEYVLFYRDAPYIDEQQVLRYRNDLVAAKFTLKANQLDGPATWYAPNGDVIKYGNFSAGLKQGVWHMYLLRNQDYFDKKDKIESFKKGQFVDSTHIMKTYRDGLADGAYESYDGKYLREKGYFKNGTAVGEWFEYEFQRTESGIFVFPLQSVLIKHYTLLEKPETVKGIIIRNDYQPKKSDREYDYYDKHDFSEFYEIHTEKEEEGLELPEEKHRSYPGEENEHRYLSIESSDVISLSDFNNDDKIYLDGKFISRNKLLDSVGYDVTYDGIYEEFYENGALKMRFEFKDHRIQEPDTIFWNSGKPMNVLTFLTDSSQYLESKFDDEGTLVTQNLYDLHGDFLRSALDLNKRKKYMIDGLNYYKRGDYDQCYRYYNYDTLDSANLKGKLLLVQNLWNFDSTVSNNVVFDADTRTLEAKTYSADRTLVNSYTAVFSEDFESLSTTDHFVYKKWSCDGIQNGSYYHSPFELPTTDSILTHRVKGYSRNYEMTSDYVLKYNNQAYTGSFELTQNHSKFALSGDENSLIIQYSNSRKNEQKIEKTFERYVKKKKATKKTDVLTESVVTEGSMAYYITNQLFDEISYFFTPVERRHFRERSRDKKGHYHTKKVSEKKSHAFDKKVVGQFKNGKPDGLWTTYDQHGNILMRVNYKNGEFDGVLQRYDFAYPDPSHTPEMYENLSVREKLLRDTFPQKPTYYLSYLSNFNNGLLTGKAFKFNWLGDTISENNYVDGRKQGFSFERTKIAYSEKHYDHGMLDGINRTYLTLPHHDSILLFDLNFQNGRLQGESKSYHTNRRLAKHGFFLSGEPIDDFEAFDTLGFKYQYVKFQFNQPVEEKIWEENQLSVRYTFDWRDSIKFLAEEITNTTSLERLIYKLGFTDEGALKPYYGRPSLVNKSGINYHMTKYYPNDTMARDGDISSGKKIGCWNFWNLEGRKLYEVEYFDSIIRINDSVRFKSKGILTYLDKNGQDLSKSYIVEKIEKYDCSHTDHHETRMLYCFWEKDTNQHRINGYVKNYYDNGVVMNEGYVKNGLATGVWKFYDPYGSLNMVGTYVLGKRDGRWLQGDLSQVKYMGDICLNPNLPNLEEIMSYQEKLLDISVIYYRMSAMKKKEYYGINMNAEDAPGEIYEEEDYDGYYDGSF